MEPKYYVVERELPKEFRTAFRYIYKTFLVPTEVVLTKDVMPLPKQGRVYYLRLFWKDGKVMSYSELSSSPAFKGTAYEEQLFLTEIWQDEGDDGHVDYVLRGYMLADKQQTEKYIDNIEHGRPSGIPFDWRKRAENQETAPAPLLSEQ